MQRFSIQQQLIMAFSALILIAVIFVQVVAYWVTREQFSEYAGEELQEQVDEIARLVSLEYTQVGDWALVDFYSPDSVFWAFSSAEWSTILENPWLEDAFEEEFEDLSEDDDEMLPIIEIADWPVPFEQLIVTNAAHEVLFSNWLEEDAGEFKNDETGVQASVSNLATNELVGFVYLSINPDLVDEEANAFLMTTLTMTAGGGVLAFLFAIGLSFPLSKQITKPLAQLTEETQTEAKKMDAHLQTQTFPNEVTTLRATFDDYLNIIETQKHLRQRLLNDLSHEINTPLSVIQLETKGLVDGLQSVDGASNIIKSEVDKLKNLVKDLNWIAETDSGAVPLNVESFDLLAALKKEIARWQVTAQQKQLTVSMTVVGVAETLFVEGDEPKLLQAIGNVLANAILYSAEHERIELLLTLKDHITIQVTDTGQGIAKEDLPHVQERFYRADASRNAHTGGRGIGLSIVQSVMDAHGGSVLIESEGLGKGTRVTLTLPVHIVG